MSAATHQDESLLARPRVAVPLIFVVTLLLQLPIFDLWFAYMDEGHQLMFADIIARGGEMYRDATIYPLPGAFYILGWAFELFGPSVILTRWIVVLEFSLFVALVFVLVRRLVSTPWAWAVVLLLYLYRVWAFPHWQNYSYSTTALLLLLGSLLSMIRFFERDSRGALVGSGLLFGLGVACKQDYGAAMLIAGSVALVVNARSGGRPVLRDLVLFIGPGAAVGALLGLYFLSHGILGDLIQQTVLGHVRGLTKFEYPEIPSLLPLFGQDPALRSPEGVFVYWPGIIFTVDIEALRSSWVYNETALYDLLIKLFFYLPYLLTLGGAIRLWRRRDALAGEGRADYLRELLLLAFALGIVLVLTVNKPQDYLHFAVVYWPFLCLVLVYLHRFLAPRRALAWVLAAVLIVPAGISIVYSVRMMERLRATNSERLAGERGGVYLRPVESRELARIVEYVHANSEPDEVVSVIPYFPYAQFLMDRMGPHRSSYLVWPFPEFEDRDQRIIRAMEEQEVQLVIYNFTQFINFPLMSEYAPDLFRYVVEHYRMDTIFSFGDSSYRLAGLKRDTRPAPGRPLVEEIVEAGALRVEPAAGPPIALPPEARDDYLAQDLWPFRPVMALRPTSDDGWTVFSLPLEVPEGARLQTAVGVNPREWFSHPSYSTSWELRVVDESGARETLFQRKLRPHSNLDERGWLDVDVSLAKFAGRRVVLEFATSTQLPDGESIWGGGWERPRLVSEASERASAGSAPAASPPLT